jgi:hypothetical protein
MSQQIIQETVSWSAVVASAVIAGAAAGFFTAHRDDENRWCLGCLGAGRRDDMTRKPMRARMPMKHMGRMKEKRAPQRP